MTRVQVEPRSCNQGRRKNNALTLLATLPTDLYNKYKAYKALHHPTMHKQFREVLILNFQILALTIHY